MAQSVNDFVHLGCTTRCNVIPAQGIADGPKRYDGQIKIINTITRKPYTNAELYNTLAQGCDPHTLAVLLSACPTLADKSVRYPNAVFHLSVRADNKVAAVSKARSELLPQLAPVLKYLSRPRTLAQVEDGSIKLRDLLCYAGDDPYLSLGNERTIRACKGAVKSIVLPAIGDMSIATIADKANYDKVMAKLKHAARNYKSTTRARAQKGYKCIIDYLQQCGASMGGAAKLLCNALVDKQARNTALTHNLRDDHLDSLQRDKYIRYLLDNHMYDVLFWVAALYCGFSPEVLAAGFLHEIAQLHCPRYTVQTYLVTKLRRHSQSRYSTIGVRNPDFPFAALRVLVLSPWAAEALLLFITALRSAGFSDPAIAVMSMSTALDGKPVNPDAMRKLIDGSLVAAGLDGAIPLMRTDNSSGDVRQISVPINTAYLCTDAKYVVGTLCGADIIMRHATFGTAATETDETAYLDLLSDAYAIARYHYLCRYTPSPLRHTKPNGALLQIIVRNDTDATHELAIDSNYGFTAAWDTEANANEKI